jgi:hypothetical protein
MEAGYLIVVIPADGWGAPWYEMYHTKENAETRIRDLAERYEMELGYDAEGLKAERYGRDYDYQHRLMEVTITRMFYDD